ncbi:protein TonB [Methylorubrum rhodinum]|uniref:Protein TonB n=1 Tax=Methylorubrum rhodinum TaxID=29428 RepID=A0A840ZH12_9HYPH|nr:TonB family protein [Methylorubrum rhodinum]MBB5756494.1 protein TonB [Methylorubrum rhodinum]
MMHPPPEAFLRAIERHRAQIESHEPSPPVRTLTWTAAGLLTLGVHVGLYLALTQQTAPPPVPLQMPAAVMIDMSPEPTVAKSTTDNATNQPDAPDSQQAKPEPEEEPPPPPEPEPIVEAPPPPPQAKPLAILPPKPPKAEKKVERKPPEKKIEKPVEKKKPEKTVQKDKPKAASRSGGGPRSDQATADRTAASAAGSEASQASRASWQNEMRARIVRAKRFPSGADGAVGVAVVSVTFSGSGSVISAQLVRSSGNAALDGEAVAVMHRAAPFPPPPGNQVITQLIPLNFSRR